jgi:hypothetical protein
VNYFDKVPEKGKKYKIRSRPWDSSFIEIEESEEGDWIFSPPEPTEQEQKYTTPFRLDKVFWIKRLFNIN